MGSINIDETILQWSDFPIFDLNTTNTLDSQQIVMRQIRDNIRKIHFDKIIDRQ